MPSTSTTTALGGTTIAGANATSRGASSARIANAGSSAAISSVHTPLPHAHGVAPHGPRKPKDDGLDPEQVDDILELKLYKLARLNFDLMTGFSTVPLQVFTIVWLVGCAGWAVQVLWRL